jgi:hypothetical protein
MSIEAMKLALDALEDTHYRIIRAGLLDQDLLNRNFTVATALRERLAQPEQEPVAINWGAVHEKLGLVWYRELSADEGLDEIQDLIHTHPPQRTWVGLTDEEKGFCAAPTYVETVARTEAKLKQKNGYAEEST